MVGGYSCAGIGDMVYFDRFSRVANIKEILASPLMLSVPSRPMPIRRLSPTGWGYSESRGF